MVKEGDVLERMTAWWDNRLGPLPEGFSFSVQECVHGVGKALHIHYKGPHMLRLAVPSTAHDVVKAKRPIEQVEVGMVVLMKNQETNTISGVWGIINRQQKRLANAA